MKNLNKNKYYKQQLQEGRKIRRLYSNLVNFTLINNSPSLLCKIIDKAVHYHNQFNYDKWEKMEESNGK
jgi:hypothetical protein